MNAKNVVKLIEACKTFGVNTLKIGSLELHFQPPGPTAIATPSVPTKEPALAVRRAIEREIEEDQDLKDLHDSIQFIEDPLAFESNLRRD